MMILPELCLLNLKKKIEKFCLRPLTFEGCVYKADVSYVGYLQDNTEAALKIVAATYGYVVKRLAN